MPAAMNYTVEKDGQVSQANEQQLMSQFQQLGYPVTGVSADGLHMLAQDPAGPKGQPGQQYQVPIKSAMERLGYQVHSLAPTQSDQTTVDPMMSGMISAMPSDDNLKRAYIEHTMKSRGIDNPSVEGSGTNWHVFNPNNHQWLQISKEGDWSHPDLAGAAQVGFALPHMLGAAVGGFGGAALGGGAASIPLAAAGGAAGSALGTAGEQAAMVELDPDYKAAIQEQLKSNPNLLDEYGTDTLKTAGLDALGEGIGVPAGALLSKFTKPAAKLVGEGLEGIGSLASPAAKTIADSNFATGAATGAFSPLAPVEATGALMSAPAGLAKIGANAPAWAAAGIRKAANSKMLSPLMFGTEEEAVQSGKAGAEQLANRLGAYSDALKAGGDSAENIVGNLVSGRAGHVSSALAADPAEAAAQQEARQGGQDWLRNVLGSEEGGVSDAEAQKFGDFMADDLRASRVDSRLDSLKGSPSNWGSTLGRVADRADAAGQLLQNAANAPTRAALRGVQGLGTAAKLAGRSLPVAERAARWAGLPWAVRYGLIPLGENEYDELTHPP